MPDRSATLADIFAYLGVAPPVSPFGRGIDYAETPGRTSPLAILARTGDPTPPGFTPAFGGAMPQSEEERQHHHWRNVLPWLAPLLPPVAAYQGGYDLARGVAERDLGTALWGAGTIGLAAVPFFAGARTASRVPASARTTPATYSGPWSPGYLDEWLAHRPHIPQHEINTVPLGRPMPRRVASERPTTSWVRDALWPGLGRRPETPEEWFQFALRQGANVTAAEALGLGAHMGIDAWRQRRDAPPDHDRRE